MFLLIDVYVMPGPYSKMRVKMPERYPNSIAAAYVNASANICADNGPGLKPEAMRRRQRCYDNKIEALDNVLRRLCPAMAPPSSQIEDYANSGTIRRRYDYSHGGQKGIEMCSSSRISKPNDSTTSSRSVRLQARQLRLQNCDIALAAAASPSPCPAPPEHAYTGGVVVHVRLGDSFCATTTYAREALRPPPASDVARVVEAALLADAAVQKQQQEAAERRKVPDWSSSLPPCMVVYSAHGGCLNATSAYVTELMELLGGNSNSSSSSGARCTLEEGVGWHTADKHFCAMVNARNFVQGSGGFSYLAERVRARRSRQHSDLNQASSALFHVAPQSNTSSVSTTNISMECLENWPTWQALVRTPIVWLDADKELAKHQAEDAAKLRAKQHGAA